MLNKFFEKFYRFQIIYVFLFLACDNTYVPQTHGKEQFVEDLTCPKNSKCSCYDSNGKLFSGDGDAPKTW